MWCRSLQEKRGLLKGARFGASLSLGLGQEAPGADPKMKFAVEQFSTSSIVFIVVSRGGAPERGQTFWVAKRLDKSHSCRELHYMRFLVVTQASLVCSSCGGGGFSISELKILSCPCLRSHLTVLVLFE